MRPSNRVCEMRASFQVSLVDLIGARPAAMALRELGSIDQTSAPEIIKLSPRGQMEGHRTNCRIIQETRIAIVEFPQMSVR